MAYLSVIMPAFNEGDHIYHNITVTRGVLVEAGFDAEIVAVDDGSSDTTFVEIERAARDISSVVPARNPYNMGKGMALRTGFDYSSGEIVVFLDADLDLHPSQIATIVNELEQGPYDIVVTSKHHPDSKLDYPRSRKIASYLYYMFIKTMFVLPVRDTQTGLKAFRREVLARVFHLLLVKKFAYDVELLATAVRFGFRIHEIPVVLDFKRALKWGRIKFADIMRIFVDTVAIFYRLRLLRYYDSNRPRASRNHRNVLVVVRGCPPPDDVLKRLSVDTDTTVACIAPTAGDKKKDVAYFEDEASLREWFSKSPGTFSFVGFLGSDCLPAGSWVKNALRNFEDTSIHAVCGPLIPGPFSTVSGRAAGLVSASVVTTGPEHRLHSYQRARSIRKGSSDNVFLRINDHGGIATDTMLFVFENGWIFDRSSAKGALFYDPDVAVSRPAPPLIVPYLIFAARDAYFRGSLRTGGWFDCIPPALWLLFISGWFFIPSIVMWSAVVFYCILVVLAGALTFDIEAFPLFVAGMFFEQLVRAVAFPVGLIAGLSRAEGRRR